MKLSIRVSLKFGAFVCPDAVTAVAAYATSQFSVFRMPADGFITLIVAVCVKCF